VSSLANWLPNYKQQYGAIENPIPEENTIADWFSFIPQNQRPGLAFNVPIIMSLEHGITADISGTAFAFKAARDSVMKNAQVDGSTLAMIGNIPYDVTFRARNGAKDGSGGGAFRSAFELKTMLMSQSHEFYRELAMLYGPGSTSTIACDIGAIGAGPTGTNLGTGAGMTCPITPASWSAGIWNHMQNALVDIIGSNGTTVRDTDVTVSGVQPDTKSLLLFKTSSSYVVVAGDRLQVAGWLGKSCIGLEAIMKNVGVMFGVDANLYPSWKVVQASAGGGQMTRAKLSGIAAKLFPNGVRKGGRFFTSAPTFADMANELDDDQRWISAEEAKMTGTNNIKYKSPAGLLDVALHSYMKDGQSMFVPPGLGKRVGSTDITFRGEGDEWFFHELDNNAGCQLRTFSNEAPFLRIPYQCAYIPNIVNLAA
jgi:hypothetical protein